MVIYVTSGCISASFTTNYGFARSAAAYIRNHVTIKIECIYFMKTQQTNKLWGSAFGVTPDNAVIEFTAGRDVAVVPPADAALVPYDIRLNKAHTVMLAKTGIIPLSDGAKLLSGLIMLDQLAAKGKWTLDPTREDVHSNIESWLTDTLGIEVAGKLHTARSRNDQVVTDMKLYLRDGVLMQVNNCITLIQSLLELAEETKGVLMPGFTHHQHAMVTTLGHTLAGFAAMLLRDIARFTAWHTLHNHCPLGGVVSYGTSYPIDRKMTASLLGFDGPDHNSLDAITNRGEAESDVVYATAIMMNHLSLIAETLILFATPEFGMLTLADGYSTGSSVMPQKKNPDPLEVVKGKAAFVHGQLMGLIGMGKGNFIGYNRDSQWAKYMVTDVLRECLPAPVVITGVIRTMILHKSHMESWSTKGFVSATVLMEQLAVAFQLPMRVAKVVVEKAVKASAGQDKVTHQSLIAALGEMGLSCSVTPMQVELWQDPHHTTKLIASYGGPGKNSIKMSLKKLNKQLNVHKMWLDSKKKSGKASEALLQNAMKSVMKGGE